MLYLTVMIYFNFKDELTFKIWVGLGQYYQNIQYVVFLQNKFGIYINMMLS